MFISVPSSLPPFLNSGWAHPLSSLGAKTSCMFRKYTKQNKSVIVLKKGGMPSMTRVQWYLKDGK